MTRIVSNLKNKRHFFLEHLFNLAENLIIEYIFFLQIKFLCVRYYFP